MSELWPLPPYQRRVLKYIMGYIVKHGYPPRHEEIQFKMKVTKNSVSPTLKLLREKGYLNAPANYKVGARGWTQTMSVTHDWEGRPVRLRWEEIIDARKQTEEGQAAQDNTGESESAECGEDGATGTKDAGE